MTNQKEMYLQNDDIQDLDERKLSYVYLPSGLSRELSENSGCNYRSAFFEDDNDLELYQKQLKDALNV